MDKYKLKIGYLLIKISENKYQFIEIQTPAKKKVTVTCDTDHDLLFSELANGKSIEISNDNPKLYNSFSQLYNLGVLEKEKEDCTHNFNDSYLRYVSRQLLYLSHYEDNKVSRYDFQERLRNASVAIIGVGGYGTALAMLLAGAGIGHLILVDGDVVEESNLSRQLLYRKEHIGLPKVQAAKRELLSINPYIKVETINKFIKKESDLDMLSGVKCIAGISGPPTRLGSIVSKWALRNKIPHLMAKPALIGPLCIPGQTPCYDCITIQFGTDKNITEQIVSNLSWMSQLHPAWAPHNFICAAISADQILKYFCKIQEVEVLDSIIAINYSDFSTTQLIIGENCGCH
ncbi:ThiF family adenylyltransferase [Geobacillus sp. TFV-3]|uniref:HesA/MoeB/ThiF family protein n=1 Tax=Geobacillus sp. TFV-3 TaxID=1897059 RepID=UPI0013587B5C|nr:ThiF family adenylyltransferase [Geobacillus sp. TFV-3]KAF0994149.1 Sulfur carrier protein ThiS adenylyltransferase [Geobacillus sp. TFV-3]KAF0996734.1 Sulfur carrier protein ThiS adenylyltransferase [Geobacillus sp. TFV-3]